jgi:predicted flavoprotein YhiN
LLPKSLSEILGELVGIDVSKNAGDLSKKEITRIVSWLKSVPLTVVGRGAGDEFVTAGGVNLHEVNPATMESKICPGLFFAGEILDVDGFTGGFNLQASWATGRLAGLSAAKL